MVKCPFCGFTNEDGALFCEQCKSDISNVAPAPSVPHTPPPTPMPESVPPVGEAPIMAAIVEEAPVMAEVVPADEPIAAAIVEEVPAEAIIAEPVQEPTPTAEVMAEAPVPPSGPAMAAGVASLAAAEVSTPAPAAAKPASGTPIPAGAQIKLVVQRGLKIGEEYSIFAGENFVGRADDKPVDVDLTFQEPEDRVWCSRQHALLVYDEDSSTLTVEDLNSSNGTFVNRERVYPGQPRQLFVGNTVQIGTVHMKIKV